MEGNGNENYEEAQSKFSFKGILRKWRSFASLVEYTITWMITYLNRGNEATPHRSSYQKKLRVAFLVLKASSQFMKVNNPKKYEAPAEVKQAGFDIGEDKLTDVVSKCDERGLDTFDGVEGMSRRLNVSLENGVSESELPLRKKIYGSNQYIEKVPKSYKTFIWEELQYLTLIILLISAIFSIVLGIATGTYDALGIMVPVFLVVTITIFSNYNPYFQYRNLVKEKSKAFVKVTRDGRDQRVSADDLVVGDIVYLSTGDHVPADGIFIDGFELFIDKSSLSGKSDPVKVCRTNHFLLSRTKVQGGHGRMLVASVGRRTRWGNKMQTLSEQREDKTPMRLKLNDVAIIKVKIGLAFFMLRFLALMARSLLGMAHENEFFVWSLNDALKVWNHFPIEGIIVVVAVLVVLPLAVKVSLHIAEEKLMNDQVFVRHTSAWEALGSISCICVNTRALTTNHMVVNKIWICNEAKVVVGNDSGDVLKSAIPEGVLSILLQCIFRNTNSEVVKRKDGKNTVLGTPTESALLELGLLLGGDFDAQRMESKVVKVEHFNPVTKKMSVRVALPTGQHRAICTGVPETVVQMCSKIIDRTGSSVLLSETQKKNALDAIKVLSHEGLGVICLAFKDINETSCGVHIPATDYTLLAVIGIKNPVRSGVKDAVHTLLATGIKVKIVTADDLRTAKVIAKESGILTDDGLAIEGSDSITKSPQEIREIQVLARSSPTEKHTFVSNLRKSGEVVAMVGGGTNDAYALYESDTGLAMGIMGTQVAKENADVIILDDNFATIVNVVKWGRAVYLNLQKIVQFQLTVNVVSLMINFVSTCLSGYATLTVFQFLWINMIMVILGMLALATEPPCDRMIKSIQVGREANFITRTMWKNIIGHSVFQLVIFAVLNFEREWLLELSGYDADSVLIIFNSLVVGQVFSVINCREIEMVNVFHGIFNRWIFILVIISMITFQLIIVEFPKTFASTVHLRWQFWLLSILIGCASMVVDVVLKCIPM